MRTARCFIRESWFRLVGLPYPLPKLPSLAELKESEWCDEFEQLMRNRFIMGAFRYGTFAEHEAAGSNGYDNVQCAIDRLKKYQETGNQENLVDAANLCLKEFRVGDHPNKHWAAQDDGTHTKKREK